MPEFLATAVDRYPGELWTVMVDLSPSLMLGLLIAGALHVFLPRGLVRRRLSGSRFRNVAEAVALGVPMTLCSCGVVPTALGLRRQGASKGATTGFLISTPQVGADSIAVSASFLGWPFALFKVLAATVTGMIGGLLVNATEPRQVLASSSEQPAEEAPRGNRLVELVRYAIFDLLASFDRWLVVGVLVSAAITVAIPQGYLDDVGWVQGIGGMLLVLALALPMYVCSTASVPIAASLIAAGMPAGSALVFLMAGPATNAATIGAVWQNLGTRILVIYLSVVAVFSVAFGLLFDFVIGGPGSAVDAHAHRHGTDWLGSFSALLLGGLVLFLVGRRIVGRFAMSEVPGDPLAESAPPPQSCCCHGVAGEAPPGCGAHDEGSQPDRD